MKVLVVDDSASMRRIIKRVLNQLGFFNIIEAEDGDAAIEVLKKDDFGLILADWNMPKMSGIELLKTVRSGKKLQHIPFIMVTAEGQKDNIIEAVKAGISSYIIKPFTPETINEKLNNIFKK